jgi:RNA polymerase sigma factor (sigma-70 family)
MDTPPPPDDGRPPKEIFLESYPVIKEIIARHARGFSHQDAEDFSQTVMARLIENDYRILREFRGRSNLRTFLTVAIQRMVLDYQNHIWGKWHYSAEAKRLGPTAKRLETLLYRDRLSFDEACRDLMGKNPELTRETLEDLRAKIPPRTQRRFVGEEQLETEADREPRPDERLEAKELDGISRRVWGVVFFCVNELDPESRLLLRLWQQLSVADIARLWKVDQKPLYRRLKNILGELRKELARRGVRRQDIKAILGKLHSRFLDFPDPDEKETE